MFGKLAVTKSREHVPVLGEEVLIQEGWELAEQYTSSCFSFGAVKNET